ncbi:MAG TPA: PAS domain S-box protein, partial [Gemmataceae bacterium]|nr:PAS domain S-box protein [Gemmataceae bacterium]
MNSSEPRDPLAANSSPPRGEGSDRIVPLPAGQAGSNGSAVAHLEKRGGRPDLLWRIYELALEGAGVSPSRRRELETALAQVQESLGELGRREERARRQLHSAEASLAEAREQSLRYHGLFEFAPDAYVVTDLSGIIQEANFAATQLFGSAKEFLIGKPLPFFVHADDRRGFYNRLTRLHDWGEPLSASEARLIWPGRREPHRVVSVTVTPILNEQGRPGGLRWLLRDVTAQKEVEGSRQAALTFIEGLLESAQVMVLVIDAEGRLVRTNTHLEEVTGYRREELADRAWQRLLFGSDTWPEPFREALEAGRSVRAAYPPRTRTGRTRTVVWSVRPLALAPASLGHGVETVPQRGVAVLAVGHDITELQEAQEKAMQLERLAAIGQTAAGLAHESRNALQRSQASLERLRWKLQDRPEALELVARAQKAQDDLVRLYESVRDYAAPIRVKPAPCQPAEVWREVWSDLRSLAPNRDAQLEEDVAPDANCTCLADRFCLAQVFRNLLENALAACTDPVRICIACSSAEAAGRPALRIAVRDNGPGLNDEQKRRMFEPFFTTKP